MRTPSLRRATATALTCSDDLGASPSWSRSAFNAHRDAGHREPAAADRDAECVPSSPASASARSLMRPPVGGEAITILAHACDLRGHNGHEYARQIERAATRHVDADAIGTKSIRPRARLRRT
jgi:hypothetical protein